MSVSYRFSHFTDGEGNLCPRRRLRDWASATETAAAMHLRFGVPVTSRVTSPLWFRGHDMSRLCLFLLSLLFLPAQASTQMPAALTELVCSASDIGLGRIERFVGYTGKGKLVTNGPFSTGPGVDGSIAMRVRVKQSLFGTGLKANQIKEIVLDGSSHLELGGMQEFYAGEDTLVFFVATPKGLRPVHDGVISRLDLPQVRRLIKDRARLCISERGKRG